MKKLFLVFLLILSISFTYADTNGVWTLAKDVKPGIFGSDEGAGYFSFMSNVGIGTTTPKGNLQVGDSNSVNSDILLIGDTRNSENGLRIHYNNDISHASYKAAVIDVRGKYFSIRGVDSSRGGDASAHRLFINLTTGNVGIGTTSPTHKLDVVGDIYMNNNKVATEFFVDQKFDLTKPSYIKSDSCFPGDIVIAWRLVGNTCTGTPDYYKDYYGDQPNDYVDAQCPGTSCTTSLGADSWSLLKPSATSCNYNDGVYTVGWGANAFTGCSISGVKICSSIYMALCEAVVN